MKNFLTKSWIIFRGQVRYLVENVSKRLRKQDSSSDDEKGSHIILRRGEPFAQLVVPDHKELDRGTLRAIIRQAGIAVDDEASLIIFAAQ